ncbi:MAG: imidazole glycerol phosphate synthase subunit HisH [Bacteroidales bacterium]|jgi:glutamine amidotransferase
MIVIVDYDTGNIKSVANAISRLGAEYLLSSDPYVIRAADHVILPGVGEASNAMQKLHQRGLDKLISTLSQPVLGICIGLQLMCLHSEEGNIHCMGIFDSKVKKFSCKNSFSGNERLNDNVSEEKIKIPHIGWNRIFSLSSPLFNGVDESSFVYYVHSYYPAICKNTIAITEHGIKFSGALNKENFYGTQFHPEKSGDVGEQILKNFMKI